jgi:hypothetical protein
VSDDFQSVGIGISQVECLPSQIASQMWMQMLVSGLLRCTTLVSGWQVNGIDLYHCGPGRGMQPLPELRASDHGGVRCCVLKVNGG